MSISRTVTRTSGCPGLSGKTTLLVGTPKSKRSVRKIPLPEFLISAVRAYEKASAQGTCYLLSNAQTPLDPRSYQKLFTRVLKHAGVKNRKFHAIRHTFATRALELGVDVKTLSELLGHSNVSTTLNIYAHSLLEQKRIAMDKFEQLHQFQMCQPLFAVREAVTSAQIC
ncbi:Tyrosine recombinase XerC [bioreactor metagenome]|uniref:Tyrosine recombinase XerC n=1 Tax=bioreactor metagenome TaxID=1076179 RepID=A0A644XR66_9ZZZZ